VLYSQDTHPSAVFFCTHKHKRRLKCSLLIWFRKIFCSTLTTVNFGDLHIRKCLNNLFLVVDRTNGIVWLVSMLRT